MPVICAVPVTASAPAPLPAEPQTILLTPVEVGALVITKLPPTLSLPVPFKVMVELKVPMFWLKVKAPVTARVEVSLMERLFVAVGAAMVSAAIVTVLVLLTVTAMLVGTVTVAPKVMALAPPIVRVPVPEIVKVPVPKFTVPAPDSA